MVVVGGVGGRGDGGGENEDEVDEDNDDEHGVVVVNGVYGHPVIYTNTTCVVYTPTHHTYFTHFPNM